MYTYILAHRSRRNNALIKEKKKVKKDVQFFGRYIMSKLSKYISSNRPTLLSQNREHFGAPLFDNLFNYLFRNIYRPISTTDDKPYNITPYIDIIEDDDSFKIEAEMPGVDEKDIKVMIKDNILTINASKETSKKDEGRNYMMREINYGSYERSILLPDNVDHDNAQSTFKKGMLWINIPKKATAPSQIKELEIKTG